MPQQRVTAQSHSVGACEGRDLIGGRKLGATAGSWVPGAFGQIVSGFIAFSAVRLLMCRISRVASAPVVDAGAMAAPTG